MDLAAMGRNKIIFVPTPGQPEQMYLAKRMKDLNWAFSVDQHKFEMGKAIHEAENYNGLAVDESTSNLLSNAIESELCA
jgi:hypothetical protein